MAEVDKPNGSVGGNPHREPYQVHPLYSGEEWTDPKASDHIIYDDAAETGNDMKFPVKFRVVKPTDKETGEKRDQTHDAVRNMHYAKALNLPTLSKSPEPRFGRALIIGGAPSVKDHLPKIRELIKDPANEIFAVNWTHTWLLKQGIIPNNCVFFEIDPEPDTILLAPHKDITYHICCHCHKKTFDSLQGYKRMLWHTCPNSNIEKDAHEELFPDVDMVGGGIYTFTRSITIALFLGFRHIDIFGCDSSFPDSSASTHVKDYETTAEMSEAMFVYAKNEETKEVRRFRTTGTLCLQAEEFKEYCRINHSLFSMYVHGDSLLQYCHKNGWPDQYRFEL